jgi:hypothetical protein
MTQNAPERRADAPERRADAPVHHPRSGEVESYARGEIRAYRGIVNKWLLVVYAALAVWGVYYLFKYWGGLGPGLGVGE